MSASTIRSLPTIASITLMSTNNAFLSVLDHRCPVLMLMSVFFKFVRLMFSYIYIYTTFYTFIMGPFLLILVRLLRGRMVGFQVQITAGDRLLCLKRFVVFLSHSMQIPA